MYFPQNLEPTPTLQLRDGSVYKANLELDRVSTAIVCVQTETENFQIHSLSAKPNHCEFFRIYPPGGTVLPTTVRGYQISNLNPQSFSLRFPNNIIPVSLSQPLSLSLSPSLFRFLSSALLCHLILLLHCL